MDYGSGLLRAFLNQLGTLLKGVGHGLLEKAENGSERLGLTVSTAILINVWIRYLKTSFKSLLIEKLYVDQTSITPGRMNGSIDENGQFLISNCRCFASAPGAEVTYL